VAVVPDAKLPAALKVIEIEVIALVLRQVPAKALARVSELPLETNVLYIVVFE
jgi:hypothetical protein